MKREEGRRPAGNAIHAARDASCNATRGMITICRQCDEIRFGEVVVVQEPNKCPGTSWESCSTRVRHQNPTFSEMMLAMILVLCLQHEHISYPLHRTTDLRSASTGPLRTVILLGR